MELKVLDSRNTAEGRWAHFGPYYAMFPLDYAYDIISRYSKEGDIVLDPFAGRFTSAYVGGVLNRHAIGIEINPVGWLFGNTKLHPASMTDVLNRLKEIYESRNDQGKNVCTMHKFYRMCFCDDVLAFLLNARNVLDWKNNEVDGTLMAFLLVYLHGKRGESLSNQMQITKSMGMRYSMDWWNRKGFTTPPEINALEFMSKRIRWRYATGLPELSKGNKAILGDCTTLIGEVGDVLKRRGEHVSLLFTSPPYCGITDYHADQWLRLWLLGGTEKPVLIHDKYRNRFNNREEYEELLQIVFGKCSELMADKSTICVRTDARDFTLNTTKRILKEVFPEYSFHCELDTLKEGSFSQTKLFGNKSSKPAEVDIVLKKG